jgi:hypothetical protein
MTLQTATRVAILGVSLGLVMSLCDTDLQYWLMAKLGLGTQSGAFFNRCYWVLRTLLVHGSILVFLITFARHGKEPPVK